MSIGLYIVNFLLISKLNSETLIRSVRYAIERQNLYNRLQSARKEQSEYIRMLPVCPKCHIVKDDSGYKHNLETFIEKNSNSNFTHGICPDCLVQEQAKIQEMFN